MLSQRCGELLELRSENDLFRFVFHSSLFPFFGKIEFNRNAVVSSNYLNVAKHYTAFPPFLKNSVRLVSRRRSASRKKSASSLNESTPIGGNTEIGRLTTSIVVTTRANGNDQSVRLGILSLLNRESRTTEIANQPRETRHSPSPRPANRSSSCRTCGLSSKVLFAAKTLEKTARIGI